jgi:uncharacterized membrane protein
MANHHLTGIATTAKIAAHPIHPMLIPFPIALLVATFVCDLIFGGPAMTSGQVQRSGL